MNFQLSLASPLGDLLLVADEHALTHVHLPAARAAPPPACREDSPLLRRAARQLTEYFAGTRRSFDLPLAPRGTEFQCAVWRALTDIDYGHTRSYSELARRIDRPRAVRAVGAANGANPLAIVVPCHRVIGKHGALTGFGGGLHAKQWLLELEGSRVPLCLPK